MALSIGSLQFEEQWLYKQLRKDLRDDWFPDPKSFCDMIDSGIAANIVRENFTSNQGRYVASGSTLFNLPKPNFTLRYALEMSLQDRLLYQGAATHLVPRFDPCLHWTVFSHRYDPNGDAQRSLFKPYVESWKNFTGGVRAALQNGTVLVNTDISNYYEHIEIERLKTTFLTLLPEVDIPVDEKSRTRDCLERLFEWLPTWAFSTARGLPQNRDASSFLANIYMIPVDRVLIATGNQYFRYMDDIKIVCPDVPSARRALKTLIIALRERGLTVNARKTEILKADDEHVGKYLSELSPEIQALDVAWNTRSRWPILRSLSSLRSQTLNLIGSGQTQSKDFRFCVRRLVWLAGCKDMPVPAEFFSEITQAIIGSLSSAPASTDEFVEYLSTVELGVLELDTLAQYLINPDHRIYTWQDYQLWLVLLRKGERDERLIEESRRLIASGEDSASRAGATLYLGRFGTALEKVVAAVRFESVTSFLGQRSAIIGIHELPFDPLIKKHVRPYVRADLQGVYTNLRRSKGLYVSKPEPVPVTKYIDQEGVVECGIQTVPHI
jgi:Reverse transcriptase (RNA-dependent DNA polymerase)